MSERKPKLLIVDDEPDTCANLQDIFQDLGHEVDVAHSGPIALELVRQKMYDVALLDLKMPGMNGLELYERMREISSGTVAIVVTAYATGDTARAVLNAGAWRILSKPVDFARLLPLVDEAVGQPLVLVVDDDHDLCRSLWDVLRDRGYRVCVAHNIGGARRQLSHGRHRIVLIDMKLPEGHGGHLLKFVQEHNQEARTILITGYRDEMEDLLTDLSGHADAVCYKPFDVQALIQTVTRLAAVQNKLI
jgi:DNA-binding NtrC family response regulator